MPFTTWRWGNGTFIKGEFVRPRNYQFLKKFFALLDVGYENWELEDQEWKGKPVIKNRERFRHDCIIMAGYFHMVFDINGESRAEADSISFANMGEDEFGELYVKVCDVLLQKVLKNYTQADLDQQVERVMNFL